MISFGLRLALRGGREAVVRLVITAAAVALGTGLLLATIAGINGVDRQNARYAWLNTGSGDAATVTATQGADPLWWRIRADYYSGQVIGRVDVAGTGPHSPVPPGIPHLPGPGEFYASPALRDLLATTPAAQLGDRFPGHLAGTIDTSALPAPNSLIVVIGHPADELSHMPGVQRVTSIVTTTPERCDGTNCDARAGINGNGMDLILAVVALALLFPVLVFIATAARLSAARREQRFAAMRLVGATPRQVAAIAAVESAVAAVLGVAVGFGLFFALRTPLAAVPFTGAPFFPADLSLNLADILLVALGVPVAAAVTARLALRRVAISPLGVSRRVTPKPPRAYRLIPLLLGIAQLAAFVVIGHPRTTYGQDAAYLPGFFLILIGLIIAGPWLTMVASRILSRRASRPATLLAARRLADHPRAAFRAVSGLILALFVMTAAVAALAAISQNNGLRGIQGEVATGTLMDRFAGDPGDPGAPPVPPAVLDEVTAVSGVTGVTVIRTNPSPSALDAAPFGLSRSYGGVPIDGVASCAQLATTPGFGRCPAGATTVQILSDAVLGGARSQADVVWPAASVPAQRLQQLPVQSIIVGTDGSTSAIEQARGILERAYPDQDPPRTLSESASRGNLAQYQHLGNVIIVVSLPIAGCTLAVSVVAGLSDRKRPFSLLRLTGAPLRVLRRVVALESAVPLVAVTVVSIGAAFLATELFVRSQFGYSVRPPGVGYYVLVVAGLVASLGVIGSTMPLLTRLTGPESARNE